MPNETNALPPTVNHVFVDGENVCKVDLAIIGSKTVHLTLLLGAQKTKLDATLVEELLRHPTNVELIRLTSSGRNALDFALAYYLGRAVLTDPGGCFHIVSKDKGYDALIQHLCSKHIRARRHDDFTTLNFSPPPKQPAPAPRPETPVPKPASKAKAPPPVLDDGLTKLLEYLRKMNPNNRPKLRTALHSHVMTLFRNRITDTGAHRLIERLRESGNVKVQANGAVTYHLERQ